MDIYTAGARAAAITTNNQAASAIWNPSSTVPLWLRRVIYANSGAATTGEFNFRRITTRGTPGAASVTADIDSHRDRNVAPPSGAQVNVAAFSVQPTLDASVLGRTTCENTIGSGLIVVFFGDVRLGPGAGLAAVQATTGDVPAGDWTWEWAE